MLLSKHHEMYLQSSSELLQELNTTWHQKQSDWSHPGYQPTVSANMVIKRFNRKVQLVEKEGWHAAELQVGFTLSKLKKNRRFLFWQVEVWKRDGWTMWTKNNNKVFSTTVTENLKYWFSLLLENTTAKHKNENWSKGLTQDTNDSTSIKMNQSI